MRTRGLSLLPLASITTKAACFSSRASSSAAHRFDMTTDLISRDPQALSKPVAPSEAQCPFPRLAKDVNYARAVQAAWRLELEARSGAARSVGSSLEYECDGAALHGYVVRRASSHRQSMLTKYPVPGIVFFHTGAGPHDIFLRWKADSLVSDEEVFGDEGCVVLIADILSDPNGWGWDADRTRYNTVRKEVLSPDEHGFRQKLQGRIRSSIEALSSIEGVDAERIGAFGWCLGGQPILELGKMRHPRVKALATFHGVFDEINQKVLDETVSSCTTPNSAQVLVCNGSGDPFVKPDDLKACEATFKRAGYAWRLLEFKHARHGFTNPAQDFNPNDSFRYNENAASEAWAEARSLLKTCLVNNKT